MEYCLGYSCIWEITFKIYWVSKSIPAAKSQKFVNISGAEKPTWTTLLESDFFKSKIQGYIDITSTKINLGPQHVHT